MVRREDPQFRPPLVVLSGSDTVEEAADMVYALDREGRFMFLNRTGEALTGYPRSELEGRRFEELFAEGIDPVEEGGRLQVPVATRTGRTVWLDLATWVEGDETWGIARDVTQQRAEIQRLREQALHDPLTGLPNRLLLADRTGQALRSARRHRRGVSLLMVDLDGFKSVNDRYGHGRGDDVLRVVSARMRAVLRSSDTVARIGGDEFVVLLPEGDASEAAVVAAKVKSAVEEPIALDGRIVRVGASLGSAVYPSDGEDVETLMDVADRAMYRAKATPSAADVSSAPSRVQRRASTRRAAVAVAAGLALALGWSGELSVVDPPTSSQPGLVRAAPHVVGTEWLSLRSGSDAHVVAAGVPGGFAELERRTVSPPDPGRGSRSHDVDRSGSGDPVGELPTGGGGGPVAAPPPSGGGAGSAPQADKGSSASSGPPSHAGPPAHSRAPEHAGPASKGDSRLKGGPPGHAGPKKAPASTKPKRGDSGANTDISSGAGKGGAEGSTRTGGRGRSR